MFSGLLTIGVKALTLFLAIQALQEVLTMQDPKVTSYIRPLTLEDRDIVGNFTFSQQDYTIAVDVKLKTH